MVLDSDWLKNVWVANHNAGKILQNLYSIGSWFNVETLKIEMSKM